jgi:hypothetical protein
MRNLSRSRVHVVDETDCAITPGYDFHRCLLSEYIAVQPDRRKYISLSKDITSKHTNVIFRNDLCDCNIEICTPEV